MSAASSGRAYWVDRPLPCMACGEYTRRRIPCGENAGVAFCVDCGEARVVVGIEQEDSNQ